VFVYNLYIVSTMAIGLKFEIIASPQFLYCKMGFSVSALVIFVCVCSITQKFGIYVCGMYSRDFKDFIT
jgi:hypothetical protein